MDIWFVDLPNNSMVDLSIVFCKRFPEGIDHGSHCFRHDKPFLGDVPHGFSMRREVNLTKPGTMFMEARDSLGLRIWDLVPATPRFEKMVLNHKKHAMMT